MVLNKCLSDCSWQVSASLSSIALETKHRGCLSTYFGNFGLVLLLNIYVLILILGVELVDAVLTRFGLNPAFQSRVVVILDVVVGPAW